MTASDSIVASNAVAVSRADERMPAGESRDTPRAWTQPSLLTLQGSLDSAEPACQ